MSEFRRRLLMLLTNGGSDMEPYKTVTLAEDHTSTSTGNPVYWGTYLTIPLINDNTDTNWYAVVFNNTYTGSRAVSIIVYYRNTSGNVACLWVRDGRTNGGTAYSSSYDLRAGSGTTIKCYKLD